MSDSPSKSIICKTDLTENELDRLIKSLLLARNDSLDFLQTAEDFLKQYEVKSWEGVPREDLTKLQEATTKLRKEVLGEKDQFGTETKGPVPLDKMPEIAKNFKDALSKLHYRTRDYFYLRLNARQYDREERLEKSYKFYLDQLRPAAKERTQETVEAPEEKKEDVIKDFIKEIDKLEKEYRNKQKPVEAPKTEQPKKPAPGLHARPETQEWVSPKLQRIPPRTAPRVKKVPLEDKEYWFKITPAISEITSLPEMREEVTDNILQLLDDQPEISFEDFSVEVRKILPSYYKVKGLPERIQRKKEEIEDAQEERKRSLSVALQQLEDHLKNIQTFENDLLFLYENWIPKSMESKSSLVKNIENYKLTLGFKELTLDTGRYAAVLKFTSSQDACKKFIELTTKADVDGAFDTDTLETLERQAADLSSIVKPGTKGPSAEEEKVLVTAIVEWLNASNAQGTEQDIERMASEYLSSKAPDYDTANIERVARKVYAEWKASQPVPSEVGQEGKANVGVANDKGTGVYVEPNRGNSNVQNEAPTAAVRKEAARQYGDDDIAKGVLVELEHTQKDKNRPATPDEAAAARKITQDHLDENPHYYDKLDVKPVGKEQLVSANKRCKKCGKPETGYRPLDQEGTCEPCRTSKMANCVLCKKVIISGSTDYKILKGEVCNDHSLKEINEAMMKESDMGDDEVCSQCDQGAHERCSGAGCKCRALPTCGGSKMKKEAALNDMGGLDYKDENELARAKANDLITLPKNVKGTNCSNCKFVKLPEKFCSHPKIQLKVTERMCCALWDADGAYRQWEQEANMEKEAELLIVAKIVKREDGWHVMSEKGKHLGGPYKSRAAAKKRLQQVEMFKHMKGATQEGAIMVFKEGDFALLNKKVGALDEGTEVEIISSSGEEVSFITGDVSGITKAANLDKIAISKEAGSPKEKYQWANDGLDFKLNLDDRVKIGSIEYDGNDLKGKEGTIRDKVIAATNGKAEKFYLVEVDECGTVTLPEESLSKAGKMSPQTWREAALNHDELTKEAVIKPNFDMVQEFLNSYDHPPTVVTTADIEAWMADPKNNYQWGKKDLKEIVKYLQSAKVEVRVPKEPKTPETLPEEEAIPGAAELTKEAKTYKTEKTDQSGAKTTITKEVAEDLGPGFETDDPQMPGQKLKWTAASLESEASCTKCAGVGNLPCDCMESLWVVTASCTKCNDEGVLPCPACKK